MTAATPPPEPEVSHSVTYISRRGRRLAAIVSAEDAERLERAEDVYLARLATDALAEMEAGAPTVVWEQLRDDLERDM